MATTKDTDNLRLRFSDIFEIPPSTVRKYGAFNISLVTDLPLFIDPFLLFNSRKKKYQQLHRRIIRYLAFLRDKSARRAIEPGSVDAWYRFPEVKQTWLGFTKTGNSGRGLGKKFANALYENLVRLFPDFGQEQVTQDSHLEKLCLIEDGVGRDNISDFTTNLIKEYLLDYTQEFTRANIHPDKSEKCAINKVRFNYGTETWERDTYLLPVYRGDYILLTPRDMLAKGDTWINKVDLIDEIQQVPDSIPDAALRAEINNYFLSLLSKEPTDKERHSAAVETIQRYPVVIDCYIRRKEDRGDEAESESTSKVQLSELLYTNQFSQLAHLLNDNTSFYKISGNTCEEAHQRMMFLKDVIENKGGHRLFYVHGEPIQREEDIHVAYRLTWFGTTSDVSREVNDGRGPADFKVSRGQKDKAIVEFKLASNSQLKKNLAKQAEIYAKASDAHCSIKVIVFFAEAELERVMKILRKLNLIHDKDVVLIDARKDNKPSGSKAA
jgi:hypothetical protein